MSETNDGIGKEGNSGLSQCEKFRFSASIGVLFTGVVVIFVARVVYVLKFGGPPTELGIVFLLATLAYPLFLFCASALLKGEVVNGLFPTESWGRYTGLMLIACILMTGTNFGVFLPVSFSDVGLVAWVAFMIFGTTFAQAVILVGSQAAEVEVFPYYEERVQITSWSAISAIICVAVTLAAGLAVMADASAGTRLICAIICSTTAIVFTVLFLPPYSRARQPRSDKDPGFIAGMKAAFAHDGLRWITAAMAFDSSAVTLNVTYLVYFLTYNLKQHSEDTGSWMGIYIGVQIITQTIFTGVGQCILGREEPLIDPQKAAAFSPILKIVFWVGIISWVDSPGPLIASFVGFGIVSVPGIFFQSVAKSWVCDEDSHVTGIRRESILQGAMGAVVWLCNNGIPALFLIGLGIAGLDPTDCTGHDSGSAAQKACEDASREAQPDAVEDFLYWALIIPCSIFYVLASVCYSRFPINGQRLQTLQEKQAEVFKRIDQIVGERSNVEIEALEVEAPAQKLDNNAEDAKDANILRQ